MVEFNDELVRHGYGRYCVIGAENEETNEEQFDSASVVKKSTSNRQKTSRNHLSSLLPNEDNDFKKYRVSQYVLEQASMSSQILSSNDIEFENEENNISFANGDNDCVFESEKKTETPLIIENEAIGERTTLESTLDENVVKKSTDIKEIAQKPITIENWDPTSEVFNSATNFYGFDETKPEARLNGYG
ncbi:unnamed protein product [Sphagnum jensenii]